MKENNNRTLIISGGNISLNFAKKYLKKEKFDYIIAADYGLLTAKKLGLDVDYILGDFDSVPKEILEGYKNKQKGDNFFKIRRYDPIKDFTDTQIAIEAAIKKDPYEIVILGGIGTRLDHTISNVQNLRLALEKNIKCTLIDEYNRLYLINKSTTIYKEDLFGPYLSLLPLTPVVEKVTLTGFKYSLENYDIHQGESIGVSNQINFKKAEIIFKKGILIVVEARD